MQFVRRTGRNYDLYRDGSSFAKHWAAYDNRPVQRFGPCRGEHCDLYRNDRQQLPRKHRRAAGYYAAGYYDHLQHGAGDHIDDSPNRDDEHHSRPNCDDGYYSSP
jgi:hypothetical protein